MTWPEKPLSKICDVFADGDWIETKDQSSEGIRLVQTGNVGDGVFKDRRDKARFISPATFERLNCTEVHPGDVLVSRLPEPVGRSCIVPDTRELMITAVDCTIIRPTRAHLDAKFLVYFTQSAAYQRNVDERCTGTTRKRISRKNLGAVPIPLPPLEEQKRIVAVLDQAFAALDRARALAEANLADAESVFLSVLRSVFANTSRKWLADTPPIPTVETVAGKTVHRSKATTQTGGRSATTRAIQGDYSLCVLPPKIEARDGWRWSALSSLARLESGHTPSRKHPEYWGGNIGWIGIKDARDHHGGIIMETNENTNELGIRNSSARILPAGTVCLSRTASVGYVVIMGKDMATSQDFVNWICGEQLEPEFLKFLLLAQGDDIRRFASGSVHQTIYFPEVKGFHICHPSRAKQSEICASLNEAWNEAKKLELLYSKKLADLDDLRQSILHKAFAGELT